MDDKTIIPSDNIIPDIADDKTSRIVTAVTLSHIDDSFLGTTDQSLDENTLKGEPLETLTVDSDMFEVKGKYYRKIKCLSDNSGEAQVFLVENEGRELVLKIYYPNFSVKKKLMKIVASINFEMIVKVYDFGKMYVGGVNRDYELMEYLQGGTLNNYHLNDDINKFRRIALQAAAALEYCHNNNVIHKDIKPGNFFFRDKEQKQLVLGDFGISSVIKDKNELHRTTQARTPIYASPEMYNDVIDGVVELTPATDYYSLGVTLLALWRGNSPFNVGERTIMKRKNEGRLPGVDTLPERVKMIVSGLTAVNIQKRWTYNEVERWFLGESPEVDLTSPFLRYKSFIVDPERNLVAENVQELIPMLLGNERIARGYLYGGRLANWFESCGNTKTAMVLKDIVTNRYPVDQHAGFMAAVYAMDQQWPYVDVNGQECNDIHSIAVSMVINASKYKVLLKNPHDTLWIYIESHTDCDVNRMRSYFTGVPTEKLNLALMRSVYEFDKDMPFLANHKSRSVRDIIKCFGNEDMDESDWKSITDGRLLSWMYSHEDKMACEALRIMTEGKPFSMSLAYEVLYNIDRTAAFDLREANTPAKVGRLFADKLKQWQTIDDKNFTANVEEWFGKDGRFIFYAQLHGWTKQLHDCNHCFDMKSEENRERLSAYDLRTAAYRFCRLLDTSPTYILPSGKELQDGRKIDTRDFVEMRNEMRNGSLKQWMAVFYHENPFETFEVEYEYERALEKWILALGSIDPQQQYYRRFVRAKEEIARKYEEVRNEYKLACSRAALLKRFFYSLVALWAVLVVALGFGNRDEMLDNGVTSICLTVGIPTAIIVGVKSYFKGFGSFIALVFALLGFMTAFLPMLALRVINNVLPSMFIPAVLAISAIYVVICHFTNNGKESEEDKELVNEVMDDDVKSSLLEPLYYTFRTKSAQFKGSKFGVLDDVKNQFKAVSGDSVIHYALWSLLALVAVIVLIFNKVV